MTSHICKEKIAALGLYFGKTNKEINKQTNKKTKQMFIFLKGILPLLPGLRTLPRKVPSVRARSRRRSLIYHGVVRIYDIRSPGFVIYLFTNLTRSQ